MRQNRSMKLPSVPQQQQQHHYVGSQILDVFEVILLIEELGRTRMGSGNQQSNKQHKLHLSQPPRAD